MLYFARWLLVRPNVVRGCPALELLGQFGHRQFLGLIVTQGI